MFSLEEYWLSLLTTEQSLQFKNIISLRQDVFSWSSLLEIIDKIFCNMMLIVWEYVSHLYLKY